MGPRRRIQSLSIVTSLDMSQVPDARPLQIALSLHETRILATTTVTDLNSS